MQQYVKIDTATLITASNMILHLKIESIEYRKFLNYSDNPKNYCYYPKIWTMRVYHREMSPKDADGIANFVDPGAVSVCQGLFVENLGSLR